MMTYKACGESGYGAASFDTSDRWHYLEVQANPTGFRVYISSHTTYRARRAEWVGRDAVAVGRAVAAGEMHPAILADWCDDNTPASRDSDFKVGEWLRAAVVEDEDFSDLPF